MISTIMVGYYRFVSRHRRLVSIGLGIVCLVLAVVSLDARLDSNFAHFFSRSTPDQAFLADYQTTFGADDTNVVAIISPAAQGSGFEAQLEALREKLSEYPEYERVDAITNLPAHAPEGLQNRYVSANGAHYLMVAVMPDEYQAIERIRKPVRHFREEVESAVASWPQPATVHFAGVPFTRFAAIRSLHWDLLVLIPVALVIFALGLFSQYRRVVAVLMPLTAIGAACLFCVATLVILGVPVNPLLSIFPILIITLVIAEAVHLMDGFRAARLEHDDLDEAGQACLEKLAMPLFLSCVTTIVGFASLMSSEMHGLYDFGLCMSIAVSFSFLLLVTAFILVVPLLGDLPVLSLKLFSFRLRRRWAGAACGAGILLLIGSGWMGRDLVVDNSLSKTLDASDSVAVGNGLLEDQFGGLLSLQLSIRGSEGIFRDPELAAAIGQFQGTIAERFEVRNVLSYVDFQQPSQAIQSVSGMSDKALSHIRVTGRFPDRGAAATLAYGEELEALARNSLRDYPITVRFTGVAPVAYAGAQAMSDELLKALLGALVLIIFFMAICYRNIKLALVSLLPNLLPISVVIAGLSILDIKLDPAAAIVFCIGLGIAINDTVHLFSEFVHQVELGHANPVSCTLNHVGPIMLKSSLILSAGFSVLLLSNFYGNRMIGGLGTALILVALLADLIFVPALLLVLNSKKAEASVQSLVPRGIS